MMETAGGDVIGQWMMSIHSVIESLLQDTGPWVRCKGFLGEGMARVFCKMTGSGIWALKGHTGQWAQANLLCWALGTQRWSDVVSAHSLVGKRRKTGN